eukprot:TRINITY_DN9417_c0_g1_i1.p1 TRINITY_DN9417_c0_g1~~TRINITY_DN9417_c0_g1_i1.p1  ORF type:complete len:2658 (-),score=590.22 TRINITY_DN9417_c0_g1_i1:2579-10552(-)
MEPTGPIANVAAYSRLRERCIEVENGIKQVKLNVMLSETGSVVKLRDLIQDILDGEIPDEEDFVYLCKSTVAKFVTLFLRRGDLHYEHCQAVNATLSQIIRLASHYWEEDQVDLIAAVDKILNENSNFYKARPAEGDVAEDGEFASSATWDVCPLFVQNINAFGRYQGLQHFLKRLSLFNRKRMSGELLKLHAKIGEKISEFLKAPYVKQLIQVLWHAVSGTIASLTEEMLKMENKTTFDDIISSMIIILTPQTPAEQAKKHELQLKLDLALKCFTCKQLDKRVAALADIKEAIDTVTRVTDARPVLSVVNWLLQNHILQLLFVNEQIQLLQRCCEIPQFLARNRQLSNADLDLIWNCSQGKHESIQQQVYLVIAELATALDIAQNQYMYSKIKSIPAAEYDEHFLRMVKLFSSNAHSTTAQPVKYGEQILWSCMLDTSPLPLPLADIAMIQLLELLTDVHNIREPILVDCIHALEHAESVPQVLQVMLHTINVYPAFGKQLGPSEMNVVQLCEILVGQHDVLNRVLSLLGNYKRLVMSRGSEIAEPDSWAFVGCRPHRYVVTQYCDFLRSVFRILTLNVLPTKKYQMTRAQVDMAWDAMVTNAISQHDRTTAFQFFENMRAAQDAEPITLDATEYLFNVKINELQFPSFTMAAFTFFDYFFRWVNWKREAFEQTEASKYIVKKRELAGIDTLWRIVFEAQDEIVGTTAISFIVKLHNQFGGEAAGRQRETYEESIAICMRNLAVPEKMEYADELRMTRALITLRMLLEQFELNFHATGGRIKRHGAAAPGLPIVLVVQLFNGGKVEFAMRENDLIGELRERTSKQFNIPINEVRFITQGHELKDDLKSLKDMKFIDRQVIGLTRKTKPDNESSPIEADNVEDISGYPSTILSRAEHFERLFALLSPRHTRLCQSTWELIMMLPTNQSLLNMIRTLNHGAPQWQVLLDNGSAFKLLYSLQIVEALMFGAYFKSPSEHETWCVQFTTLGGVHYLVDTLLRVQFHEAELGSLRLKCLSLLLRVIQFFCMSKKQLRVSGDVFGVAPSAVLVRLLDTVQTTSMIAFEDEPVSVEVVRDAMVLLVATCLALNETMSAVLEYNLKDWLATVLLNCPVAGVREEVQVKFGELCVNVPVMGDEPSPSVHILNLLLGFLSDVLPGHATCDKYFQLTCVLYSDVAIRSPSFLPDGQLLHELVRRIQEHPIIESRVSVEARIDDQVLIGLLQLTKQILAFDSSRKPASGRALLDTLFNACLFDVPQAGSNLEPTVPPKCKSKMARSAAFDLLLELCKDCPENMLAVVRLMIPQQREGDARTTWNYQPNQFDKSLTGYVGLKNQGATCYMNSLMQQLYMVPTFRKGLLDAPDTEPDKAESLLYQLQTMFGALQESQKRYYDTVPFCHSYKDYDQQPMDMRVQMDVDEFFNMLFDRLEKLLKPSPQQELLTQVFGGKVCHQTISKDCEHRSETLETFYTMSVDVRNKKSLYESLELYSEGDMLDGDNKYKCEQCNKLVTAQRRSCVAELPDNLIVHLKRFEFDMDIMRKIKLNTYCEFPLELNMEPYTREGLAAREAAKTGVRDPTAPAHRPDDYYRYELQGILVHTGTADTGHYYSFVKERVPQPGHDQCRWLLFNDSNVEFFDPSEIASNCYGGEDIVQQYDAVAKKPVPRRVARSHNAYMLFYQRVSVRPESVRAVARVPQAIYELTWQENLTFLFDKNVFDEQYFDFVEQMARIEYPVQQDSLDIGDSDLSVQVVQLLCKFFVETYAHSKDKAHLNAWVDVIKGKLAASVASCRWLLGEVSEPDCYWLKQLLLVCPLPEVRAAFAAILVHAIQTIRPYEMTSYLEQDDSFMADVTDADADLMDDDELEALSIPRSKTVVARFVDRLLALLRKAHKHWRTFGHYFRIIYDVANLGAEERELLINRQTITRLIDFFLWDESPRNKMSAQPRKKVKMGDKFQSACLGELTTSLAILVTSCKPPQEISTSPPPPKLIEPAVPFGVTDRDMLLCKEFYMRTLRDATCVQGIKEIVEHLCWENSELSLVFISWMLHGTQGVMYDHLLPFFEVISCLFGLKDSHQLARIQEGMSKLIKSLTEGTEYKNASAHYMVFLERLAADNVLVRDWLFEQRALWLLAFVVAPVQDHVREAASNLVKTVMTADRQRVAGMYQSLLGLLMRLKPYLGKEHHITDKVEDLAYGTNYWKAAQFLRLLQYCIQAPEDYLAFLTYYGQLFALWDLLNAYHFDCDENKKELVVLVHKFIQDKANLEHLALDTVRSHQLLDFYISLRPEMRAIQYNNSAQSVFYSIIYELAMFSGTYLGAVSEHNNWNWAIRYFVVEGGESYPDVTPVVMKLAVECVNRVSEFGPRSLSQIFVNKERLGANTFSYLCQLLRTWDDARQLGKEGNLEVVSHVVESQAERAITTSEWNAVGTAALVLIRWIHLACQPPSDKVRLDSDKFWPSRRRLALPCLHAICKGDTPVNARFQLCQLLYCLVEESTGVRDQVLTAMDQDRSLVVRPLVQFGHLHAGDMKTDSALVDFIGAFYQMILVPVRQTLKSTSTKGVDLGLQAWFGCVARSTLLPGIHIPLVKELTTILRDAPTALERTALCIGPIEDAIRMFIARIELHRSAEWQELLQLLVPVVIGKLPHNIQQDVARIRDQLTQSAANV